MKEFISLQNKIIPEMVELLQKRYLILRNIYVLQPIGRRSLANKLAIGERVVRTEVEFFKEQGLIEINSAGMVVTQEGEEIIEYLLEYIYSIRDIKYIEGRLKKKLDIREVIVVPGNIEEDEYVLDDIGKATAKVIEGMIFDNNIIGITGGNTMAAVAKGITKSTKHNNIVVVPARGGLGKKVESQANTIAAEMARRLRCQYQLLHASDSLGEQAMDIILQDPEIQKIIKVIKSVNLLVFGIGRANEMATRRDLSESVTEKLKNARAVAEAFGYYFNRNGEIVYEMKTIGISFKDFEKIATVIGVAGGKDKAEAIVAISKLKKSMILVTDEAAALEILGNY
ncbi:MAG: sugar-binding transcriptional regulator [Clostridiaceae bacterium]|nr:sugar-binding transcriptional regulator [Clostridiaceae bacterium]